MNAFKKELGLYDVPFLLGGLGDFLKDCCDKDSQFENYTYINESLEKIAENNPMTGFISAKGLTSNPDNLHFNAKSLREFGVRYYNGFMKLEDKNKVFTEKSKDGFVRTKLELL